MCRRTSEFLTASAWVIAHLNPWRREHVSSHICIPDSQSLDPGILRCQGKSLSLLSNKCVTLTVGRMQCATHDALIEHLKTGHGYGDGKVVVMSETDAEKLCTARKTHGTLAAITNIYTVFYKIKIFHLLGLMLDREMEAMTAMMEA